MFVAGSTTAPSGYTAANYGNESSCEDQVGMLCPMTDLTPAQTSAYTACETAAPTGACGKVPGSVGVEMPAACSSLFPS